LSSDLVSGLDGQLLDDFFGEADEHLIRIRQGLLRLESSVDKAEPDMKIVKDIFQDFHSLKGISAIVGLRPAETVAHAAEDYLRLMRDGKAQFTVKGREVLTSATHKLEQVIAAFRSQIPLPGYESLLGDLRKECEQWSNTNAEASRDKSRHISSDPSLLTAVEEAKARGLLLWKFIFSPTRALDAQGTNVNSVREQLSTIGEILNSASNVEGKDTLVFEFLVATSQAPTDLSAWESKGITVEPAELGNVELPTSPAQTGTAEETDHNPFLAPSHIVRVDLKRLDDLMRITGEMVIHRSRLDSDLTRLEKNGGGDLSSLWEASGALARSVRELRDAVTRVRLIPVAEIFARMPFVVRDLARQTHKMVRLRLSGQETAIDKYLIERLKDPLLHLVRNAFSHGVETPAERVAAAKAEEATIELSASTVGDAVIIQVRDDGRGINPNTIVRQAAEMGLDTPDKLDNESILKILCLSGFSTRADADLTSGRGVGMAVVCATVRELGGSLTMNSEEGRGTQFTIRVPLTLSIAETLIVCSAGQTWAVPQDFVREILHKTENDIQKANGLEIIPYRSGILPVVRLAEFFRLTAAPKAKFCLLVIESERGSVGLLTDEIVGQREIVVRALHDPLIQIPGISGATELGDGKPVLILDASALTRGTVRPTEHSCGRQTELSAAKMR
jgi:two-component system chemotaxis sensor kinase CheA